MSTLIARIAAAVVILALLPSILHVYGLSEEATSLTTKIVWWHAIFEVFIWPLGYTLPVTFRAAGDAKFPMMVGTLTMIFCRIAFAYLLSIYFHMGAAVFTVAGRSKIPVGRSKGTFILLLTQIMIEAKTR